MAAKVLIVDDSPENVAAFCAILNSYINELEIITADSGTKCVEKAREHLPDVVLLDVHMPGMDGFEACRIIKSTPETQNISVLMVSALMTAGRYRAAGMDSGADGYLCKPFDSAELIAQVRALIRLKRYEDELRLQQERLEIELSDRTAKLRQSEANWRRLFELAPDPIFVEDLEGNVLEANQAACQLHRMTYEELLTKNVKDLVPPEQQKRVCEFFQARISDALYNMEGFSYTKDGKVIPVELRARRFHYFGRPSILFYVRDISERLQMEQELLQAQKLESIGLLAGGIAHDFNNIMMGVIGNLSLLKLDVSPDNPIHGALCDAEESALRARFLTQQLLTFSRGGAPLLKTASMRHLLEVTPRFVLSGSSVVCDISIAEDLWLVEIDVGQMSQVIENLVINALHAMSGGGVITLAAENVEVDGALRFRHRTLKGTRAVKIVVADKGTGIAPENLTRIFDPYFTTKEAGSGLGLATTYAIIKKHGGTISVESEPGNGATFTIYLPASMQVLEEITPNQDQQPVYGKGRILVMDDEKTILKVMTAALSKLGYSVVCVEDGREALEAYQKAMRDGASFDAVILDLTVPGGMGGEETIKLISAIDPKVKAIVSSGYTAGMAMSLPECCGFKASIEKPYSIQSLSLLLHEVLK